MMGVELTVEGIPAARVAMMQQGIAMREQEPIIEDVITEDRIVPGPVDAPDVAIRIYKPNNQSERLPALMWMHGGGYIMGTIDREDLAAKYFTLAGECITISVDYRLAPEHPFPAPVEDCYAALKWLATHVDELGVDANRIAIGGASAGGGLAAGLALLTRDRAEVNIISQFLIYAMLDDRNTKPASDTLPDSLLWTRDKNRLGWGCYLGFEPGGDEVSCYASAARSKDLTGLPNTYIAVGDLDLFVQENLEYAGRLVDAGVATELHLYPGGCHAFDKLAPEADISRQFTNDLYRALKRSLHGK